MWNKLKIFTKDSWKYLKFSLNLFLDASIIRYFFPKKTIINFHYHITSKMTKSELVVENDFDEKYGFTEENGWYHNDYITNHYNKNIELTNHYLDNSEMIVLLTIATIFFCIPMFYNIKQYYQSNNNLEIETNEINNELLNIDEVNQINIDNFQPSMNNSRFRHNVTL